jgi:hypothetical protein
MDSTVVSLLRCLPAGRRAHRAPAGRPLRPFWRSYLEPRVHVREQKEERSRQPARPGAYLGLATCCVAVLSTVCLPSLRACTAPATPGGDRRGPTTF